MEKRRFVTRASSYRGKEKTDGRLAGDPTHRWRRVEWWAGIRRGGSCGEEEGQVWMNDFWISKGMKSSKLRGVERGNVNIFLFL